MTTTLLNVLSGFYRGSGSLSFVVATVASSSNGVSVGAQNASGFLIPSSLPATLNDYSGYNPQSSGGIWSTYINEVGNGSITVPVGANHMGVMIVGGGGGAGVGTNSYGGGGGGGGLAWSNISVTAGTVYSYTIGSGGNGGANTAGSSGTAGQSSTISGTGLSMTAYGGNPGANQTNGTGGTASGGNVGNATGTTAPAMYGGCPGSFPAIGPLGSAYVSPTPGSSVYPGGSISQAQSLSSYGYLCGAYPGGGGAGGYYPSDTSKLRWSNPGGGIGNPGGLWYYFY